MITLGVARDHSIVSAFVLILRRGLTKAGKAFLKSTEKSAFAYLRIGTSLVLLTQCFGESGSLLRLYGEHGLLPWQIGDYVAYPMLPRLSAIAHYLTYLHLSSDSSVFLIFGVYVLSLFCLLLGLETRLAALSSWFLHLAFIATSYTSVYGVDVFTNIALFYCFVGPSGHCHSLDNRLRKRSYAALRATLWLRTLQIHLCLVYLSAAIEKSRGRDWWTGESIWRAVMQPQFGGIVSFQWLAHFPVFAVLAGWSTLLVEGLYCILIWIPKMRPIWLCAIIALHLGIGLFMGLHLFAAIMIVLSVSAFGSEYLNRALAYLAAFARGYPRRSSLPPGEASAHRSCSHSCRTGSRADPA